eukprot:11917600-Ditylum_brightwellii.AAC.1
MSSCAKQMPINQQCPGKASWRLWRKAMTIWALDPKLKVKASDKYVKYSKNSKNAFINGEYVSWQPTESSAPFYIETTDGAESWYGPYCHGVVGELYKPRISRIDSYIDILELWEGETLSDVDMVYSCHELRDMLDDRHMLIATDGSA